MTPNSVTITSDQLAVEALNLMQARRINALLVTKDEHSKHAIGALKMYDLLKAGVV
jgi:arabinose-5-phosphate isomerase